MYCCVRYWRIATIQQCASVISIIIYECSEPKKNGQPNFTGRFIKANFNAINQNIDERTKTYIDKNRFVLMREEEFEQLGKNHASNDEH